MSVWCNNEWNKIGELRSGLLQMARNCSCDILGMVRGTVSSPTALLSSLENLDLFAGPAAMQQTVTKQTDTLIQNISLHNDHIKAWKMWPTDVNSIQQKPTSALRQKPVALTGVQLLHPSQQWGLENTTCYFSVLLKHVNNRTTYCTPVLQVISCARFSQNILQQSWHTDPGRTTISQKKQRMMRMLIK